MSDVHTKLMAMIADAIDAIARERDEARAEVERLREELEDWEASARRAAGEQCGAEKHCTCVGVLRAEVERLREENVELREGLIEGGRAEARLDEEAERLRAAVKEAATLIERARDKTEWSQTGPYDRWLAEHGGEVE